MNKNEIINDIKENNGAEIAALQQKFNISYKEVKLIIDELVANGTLVFESGIKYSYAKKKDTSLADSRAELERRREEAIKKIQAEDSDDDSAEERARAERKAYLEARRQELIRRMQAEMQDDDDEDEDDSDEEGDDDEEIGEEELRYKALKLIIEKGRASVSMFQRSFPIGYIRSCKLIDWMESKGYVSEGGGSTPRKVLITKEEFNKLYNEPHMIEDEDDDDDDDEWDIDEKFAEYEKFLEQHFSDDDSDEEREEDEAYDRIINRIFHSDEDEGEDSTERKRTIQNLASAVNKVADKMKAPITADEMPLHPSWNNEDEFAKVVMERMERLIKSDKRMGHHGAVKKAETYLEAVRDTHDRKMVQVYERLVYEIKNTSGYLYGQLKKQFFGE